ncbi:inositol monophosphatase family protein [Sphingomonas aerolata]|uniref:inositol monophosphatase family protein n=1 Tax=Sphingomonas aerolata TaxID=185951 RepID=UPI002FE05F7B
MSSASGATTCDDRPDRCRTRALGGARGRRAPAGDPGARDDRGGGNGAGRPRGQYADHRPAARRTPGRFHPVRRIARRSQPLQQRSVWIVDPLDGTREYAEGLEDWAVHIGLAIDGVPRVGAVAVPARGAIFATDDPARSRAPAGEPLRIVVGRSRAPDIARRVGGRDGGDAGADGIGGSQGDGGRRWTGRRLSA